MLTKQNQQKISTWGKLYFSKSYKKKASKNCFFVELKNKEVKSLY
jgi:hypothetical protein